MEYWYLWLLLIVLCVITVFVLSKASAAAKKLSLIHISEPTRH